ncbi:erkB [Symbiodinium sp. KB8]|nr:erkB [Symbiodinium sp. KB8]
MTDTIEQHVLQKFQIIRKLGKGAYGVVWKAKDNRTDQIVALKKCYDAFRNATDAQRTFRECMYLTELRDHPNVVRLLNIIRAENDRDLYLVFEYLEADLHAVIRAGILQDVHIRYIVYQLLKVLKYLHSAELLHRDVKPSNMLLNAACTMKACDFGLSRSLTDTGKSDVVHTDYVATRWYRPPEILLGAPKHTFGIDMWSVGTVLGECYRKKPMFPGNSTINQLELVLAITGRPSPEDVASIGSKYTEQMIAKVPATASKTTLEKLCPGAPEDAIDLMTKCMQFNPAKRITAVEALAHPFVAQFHDESQEVTAPRILRIKLDDDTKYSTSHYRKKLYLEIKEMKQRARARAKAAAAAASGGPAPAPAPAAAAAAAASTTTTTAGQAATPSAAAAAKAPTTSTTTAGRAAAATGAPTEPTPATSTTAVGAPAAAGTGQ